MKIEYLLSSNDTLIKSQTYRINYNKPNLTDIQREMIYELAKQHSINGRLPRGLLGEISEKFGVKPRTVSRIWYQGQKSLKEGFYLNVRSKIKFSSGRRKTCKG